MRACVVVTTHARPGALARVLASVASQSRIPAEVIVAEDGEDRATTEVVEAVAASFPCPLRLVRQPHEGFRAGRIRNAAIAATNCDYVVLVDGDMVVHPRFLEDHLALARRGAYCQGTRILLDAEATRRLEHGDAALPGVASPGLGLLRRTYAWRSPRAARVLAKAANGIVAIKSCNQGFWRHDLLAVNGFDEAMTGWGSEDKELCARLENSGVHRRTLLFAALAFHLDHPAAPRANAEANRLRWQETVRLRRTRCELGLDGHLAG